MSEPPRDRRPPLAVAMERASQVTTIAVMMVLPAWAGYWVDGKLGTAPWLLILGAGGGLAVGFLQLLKLVGNTKRSKNGTSPPKGSR